MSPDAREPEDDRTAEVLSSLPRHRPGRRTGRRAADNGVSAGGAGGGDRGGAKPPRSPRKAPRSAAGAGPASAAATSRITIPRQGFETEDEVRVGTGVEPPSRLEMASSLLEVVGEGVEELVKTSASATAKLARRAFELVPKP